MQLAQDGLADWLMFLEDTKKPIPAASDIRTLKLEKNQIATLILADTESWRKNAGGAGRPVGWRKENPMQRAHRQLRAFDDEWQVIKDFVKLMRERGVDDTKKILDAISADN